MSNNKISQILYYIGIFIIGISFIIGIVNGNVVSEFDDFFYESSFSWGTFFTTVLIGLISGMVVIGLSEIIKLLHSINVKMGENGNQDGESLYSVESSANGAKREKSKTWVLDGTDREMALEMELLQGAELIDIIPTPFVRYGVVVVKRDEVTLERVVDFGGFRAEEIDDKELINKVLAWYVEQK